MCCFYQILAVAALLLHWQSQDMTTVYHYNNRYSILECIDLTVNLAAYGITTFCYRYTSTCQSALLGHALFQQVLAFVDGFQNFLSTT